VCRGAWCQSNASNIRVLGVHSGLPFIPMGSLKTAKSIDWFSDEVVNFQAQDNLFKSQS